MSEPNFVVYKSSAGSGKTFTLVKEYLKLALKDKRFLALSFKSILAITFTNKAAAEMKMRIIKALKEISTNDNPFLSGLIAKELNIDESDLQQRATVLLTEILHNYSDFSIGTIDSFTHRIIRTFALDLKLPLNFQIETDTDSVFQKIISLLINGLGKDTTITDYLLQFSLNQLEDNKHWDPELLLLGFVKEINKEGVGELVEKLNAFDLDYFESLKQQILTVKKEYEQKVKQAGKEALDLIASKRLSADVFAYGNAGIYNFFVKAAELKETTLNGLLNKNVLKTIDEDNWSAGKATLTDKQAIDSIKDELKKSARSLIDFISENEQRYIVFSLILKNIYAMGLINELSKLLQQYKQEENILFISEFNEKIADVVAAEPTPFIFERLGDKYKHFLLDEFQDTSTMQWHNMLPLIDNSLGNGNSNLIVGDGKQSIYRWRNADVEQFVNLPQIITTHTNDVLQQREHALIRNFKEEVLSKNFRSEPVIVQFNNRLFDYLSENYLHDDLKKIYHKQAQESKKEGGGFVSIDFPVTDELSNDEVNQSLVINYVQSALNSGYLYNDICIIVRNNGHGTKLASFLIENNIPVVSADSLLLGKSEEINVLLSFLKYIVNQKDLVSAATVLEFLRETGVCETPVVFELIRYLNANKQATLFDALTRCGLAVDETKLTSSNLFDTCVEIASMLRLNIRNPQYVRFFLDEILSFLQSHTSNTSVFLDWWGRRSAVASVIIPDGINAVNIMTIHASKGLEFPVVITPYASWKIDAKDNVWVDLQEENLDLPVALLPTTNLAAETVYKPAILKEKQQQVLDNLNLLYVDFTRAVERLHVISHKPKNANENTTFAWLYKYASQQKEFNAEEQKICYGNLSAKLNTHHKQALPQIKISKLTFNKKEDIIEIKGGSNYTSNEEVLKAREYGILVHYILSQIVTEEDIAPVIHAAFTAGDLTGEEAFRIEADIKRLLKIPSISHFFEKGIAVKNEIEILSDKGEILRPDRVVADGENAAVIDYKTGKKQDSKYSAQMRQYEQALLALGYKKVTKVLLYIHEQEAEILN